jgi:hypothetical protein
MEVAGCAQDVSKVTGRLISLVTIRIGPTRSVSFVRIAVQMSMREPAEYGNDEVPIPVFYVLEIYLDTFRHEKPVVEIHTAEL